LPFLLRVQRLINIATVIVFAVYIRGRSISFKGVGLCYNCLRGKNASRHTVIEDSALRIP
jgi:hypothetical protein